MKWHKPARVAVAIFGIACAIVVYGAIGERQVVTPPEPPARLDPKAVLESEGTQVQQERGAQRDFDVTSERNLSYEDGSTRMIGVVIRVRGRAGRDYVLKGEEARAGENQRVLELSGAVTLEASDGFELHADRGSFNQDDGVVRVPGEVTFARGRMSGAGVGMTYDEANDVITILDRARFAMMEEEGRVAYAFNASRAVLDRKAHVLTLDGEVRGLRGEQAFEGDHALARMTAAEDALTFIELRGNAGVHGGHSTLESMSARDIDLDYTEDGETLERVRMAGNAVVALSGQDGAAGRTIGGETLDLAVAADGSVTQAIGRDNVRLDLEADDRTPARRVTARNLDAGGEPGRGLTEARFDGDVDYREQAKGDAAARAATSRSLRVSMDGNAINAAIFTGDVTFEEQGLRASGGDARYEPDAGTLRLAGGAGALPRVADQQVLIEAQKSIDVTLASRRMYAVGSVRTVLRASGDTTLPGLLNKEEPANVKGDVLEYEGEAGSALYRGNAELWQGQTAIRAETITIDRKNGDLAASGAARATLALDGDNTIGRADEIRYADSTRIVSFVTRAAESVPVTAPARGGAAPPARGASTPPGRGALPPALPMQAQLVGPQGTVTANRIDVVLAREGSRVDRLEGETNVTLRLDTRTATGARLTYHAADERYVMTGANAVPVRVVDACRETSGKTLTFFKTADRIVVDGNEEIRTQTKSGGPCAAAPAR